MLTSLIQGEIKLTDRLERAAPHLPSRRYYMAASSVQDHEKVISKVYKLGSQEKESCYQTHTQIVSFLFQGLCACHA